MGKTLRFIYYFLALKMEALISIITYKMTLLIRNLLKEI